MGGTLVYNCDRCPLILELGDHFSDWPGLVRWIQVACASCGTMHRLTERNDTCQVTVLPGPVRETRTVTFRDITGEEVESYEVALQSDWLPVGPHAGGIAAVGELPCSHCGQVGRMVTLSGLLYPTGNAAGVPPREDCPVCGHRMRLFAITDSI